MDSKFEVRMARPEDLKFPNQFLIQNGFRFGPNDITCAYNFDPSSFFVGELNGKVISHVNMTKFPGHSTFVGLFMVSEEHRGKGYGKKTWEAAWKTLDQSCTIGLEALQPMIPTYQKLGFHVTWETPLAFLDFEKITKNLSDIQIPFGVSVAPIKLVDREKLLLYDSSVFGTSRRILMDEWLDIPGCHGWAASNDNGDVVGVIVIRHLIVNEGTALALDVSPFYADSGKIARALLKAAAEICLANSAIPASGFEMWFPKGGQAGNHAAQLVAEVEGTSKPFCTRMYTKGIPPGRQVDKMYGLLNLAFD